MVASRALWLSRNGRDAKSSPNPMGHGQLHLVPASSVRRIRTSQGRLPDGKRPYPNQLGWRSAPESGPETLPEGMNGRKNLNCLSPSGKEETSYELVFWLIVGSKIVLIQQQMFVCFLSPQKAVLPSSLRPEMTLRRHTRCMACLAATSRTSPQQVTDACWLMTWASNTATASGAFKEQH